MAIDPLSLFGTILAVVQLIGMAAKKMWDNKSQGKHKCLELAGRAKDLAVVLHEVPHAAVSDTATAGVQQRLKDALDEAFRLINYCQKGKGGVLSAKYCCRKVTELDNVDKTISKCILDLMYISQAHGHSSSLVPDVHGNNYYYNQARGGAPIACVGWPAPAPQHEGSTSQASNQPPCVGWPSPVQYPALGYVRPTTPWDHGAPDSFSVKKEEQLQEHSLVEARAEEEAAVDRMMVASLAAARDQEVVNRVMEESLASARGEEAALNLAGEESLASAALNRVLEDRLALERADEEAAAIRLVDDFVASTRALDEAAVNRGLEESLATAHAQDQEAVVYRPLEDSAASTGAEEEATVNRVVEESLALARAEEAVVNRAMEESLALLRVEDMVRALCASPNLEGSRDVN